MARGTRTAPSYSVLHLLHRAGQNADALFAQHIGKSPLSARQFAILQAVAKADGLSQTAIMAATGIDRSSTAELVRRLVAQGWLTRRRTRRDQRLYAVRLTARGRHVLRAGARAEQVAEEALFAGIPAAERTRFCRTLTMLAGAPE
jgi:DNA-binding MarR family transcriptional regulator